MTRFQEPVQSTSVAAVSNSADLRFALTAPWHLNRLFPLVECDYLVPFAFPGFVVFDDRDVYFADAVEAVEIVQLAVLLLRIVRRAEARNAR
jgi:hypothetical protein